MADGILNLTPHDVCVHHADDSISVFPRVVDDAGKTAECRLTTVQPYIGKLVLPSALGAAIEIELYGPQQATGITGLPADASRTKAIVVSAMVGEYLAANSGVWPGAVYAPDSSPASVVRDQKGQIVGVRRFVLYKRAY